MSLPPTMTAPSVGVSRPPAIEQSVVFPEPDGPTSARISSAPTVRSTPSSGSDLVLAAAIDLAHALHLQRTVLRPAPVAVVSPADPCVVWVLAWSDA